jgi:hypothetical protein
MSESPFAPKQPEAPPPPPPPQIIIRRRPLWQRAGCLMGTVVWFILLLAFPCAMVTLLVEGELIFDQSDLPEDEVRIFLLSNSDARGLGLQRGSVESGGVDEGEFCIVTTTTYFLWEGEGDNQTTCNCYERINEDWSAVMVGGDENCNPPE